MAWVQSFSRGGEPAHRLFPERWRHSGALSSRWHGQGHQPGAPATRYGFWRVTLAYVARGQDEVDRVMELAERAGGEIVKRPQRVFWGGYSGYFRDLDGYYWEVMYWEDWKFKKRDWFDYPPGFSCILIGQKKPRPPLSETYRQALEWMLQVTRTPVTFGDRHNGLAAYAAWAEQLLRDEDFPDDETLLRQRHDVHNNVVGTLAEARAYGSRFLIDMATI